MSAAEDKPLKNLVALYHLEFYRKKNHWQFKNSRHKKRARKRAEKQSDLNKTYLLESCGDKQDSDVLNVAFIDADSEHVQEASAAGARMSRQATLSQQWQHPINIWPTPADSPCSNSERLQNLRQAISQYGLEGTDNEQNSMKEAFPCVDGYAEPDVQMQEPYGWGQHHEEAPDIWGVQQGGLWSEEKEDLWSAQVNAGLDAVDGPGGFPAAGCFAEGLRFCPLACDLEMLNDQQQWLDASQDSEEEFVRGAHVAPHSSEVDLSLPEELLLPHLRSATLLRLSSRQLLRAQQHCAGTLTRLMLEDRRRQKLRSATSREFSSYEEFPTRDCGFDPSVPPPARDRVLAGSHLPAPPALAPGAAGDLWAPPPALAPRAPGDLWAPPPALAPRAPGDLWAPPPALAPRAPGDLWAPHCGLRPASAGRGRGRLL